jgi:hypothetical protein
MWIMNVFHCNETTNQPLFFSVYIGRYFLHCFIRVSFKCVELLVFTVFFQSFCRICFVNQYTHYFIYNLLYLIIFLSIVFNLQAGRSRDRIRIRSLDFFNIPNPSSRTMALGSTLPLTEMSTRNILGGKGRPARKAENLTVIYEPIV